MSGPAGFISEIYSSLQGEGVRMGERQVFIRFAGCPLRCTWCDTPESLGAGGHRAWTVEEAAVRLRTLRGDGPLRATFTGGEPLVQAEFIEALLPLLVREGWWIHLETAGVHPLALTRVARFCGHVSMDIKLPSATGRDFWPEHEAFLKAARGRVSVKIVLTGGSEDEEVRRAVRLVAAEDAGIPLVFQPVTPIAPLRDRRPRRKDPAVSGGSLLLPPEPERVLAWRRWARALLKDVRILVQMHPLWGLP